MIRCPSCEHGREIHDADGRCWFTVASGLPGTNLVCPCKVRPEELEAVVEKRRSRVLREYTPDFPAFVYWIWGAILVVPLLVSVIIQVTG